MIAHRNRGQSEEVVPNPDDVGGCIDGVNGDRMFLTDVVDFVCEFVRESFIPEAFASPIGVALVLLQVPDVVLVLDQG